MVVMLPESRHIVIDAKVPLSGYLKALDASNTEEKRTHLVKHAEQVRSHITSLSRKAYWRQFDPTPEFVILFIPGDQFLSAALKYDPELIEFGVQRNVMVGTPMTLIPLLKTIAYVWRTESAAENAKMIGRLGTDLHSRISLMVEKIVSLGKGMDKCAVLYNQLSKTFETNVLPSVKKLEAYGIESGCSIGKIPPSASSRSIRIPALLQDAAEDSHKESMDEKASLSN